MLPPLHDFLAHDAFALPERAITEGVSLSLSYDQRPPRQLERSRPCGAGLRAGAPDLTAPFILAQRAGGWEMGPERQRAPLRRGRMAPRGACPSTGPEEIA
jgi:hypothetical protein